MSDSILISVKEDIGFTADYTPFDNKIIRSINSAMMALWQLGLVGGISKITGIAESWSDYIGNEEHLEAVQSYICGRARKEVDPPTSGAVMQALNEQIREAEWRISVAVDPSPSNVLRGG